jgi:hypothetical protein
MSGDRSINVGRDVIGSVVVTGNHVSIDATIEAHTKTTLPPAETVNISDELRQIRSILEQLQGENAAKIGRALDDATEEAEKSKPDNDELGGALSRALDYAKATSGFVDVASKLAPHVKNAVGWLGANWHKLLPIVGIVL